MAIRHISVDPVQATTAGVAVYTVPSNQSFKVLAMTVVNDAASARTVTVYRLPSGGTAGATNIVVKARNLDVSESAIIYEMIGQVIEAGGVLTVAASADSSITVHVSGLLLTE